MTNFVASKDENSVPTLLAASSVDGKSTVTLYANPSTHRLLVDATAGVVGPVSSTDGNVALWDGTTGDTLKDSTVSVSGTGVLAVNSSIAAYAAGTAYSLTNAQAALVFGTTSPSITINVAGTYLLLSVVRIDYNGATFAASRNATLKLRRTNNTAADVTNATTTYETAVVTLLTDTMATINLPPVVYTTSNTNDIVTIFGGLNTAPSAGSLDAVEASLVAIRLS